MELTLSRGAPSLKATEVELSDSGDRQAALRTPCQEGKTAVGEMSEVDYESLPTDRLSAHLIAGGAAGIMEHCVMYPVDCVKVRERRKEGRER